MPKVPKDPTLPPTLPQNYEMMADTRPRPPTTMAEYYPAWDARGLKKLAKPPYKFRAVSAEDAAKVPRMDGSWLWDKMPSRLNLNFPGSYDLPGSDEGNGADEQQ